MGEKKEIRVKFEIGDIKFEAEGSADLVERERSVFNNTLLPAAIEAIVRTRGVAQNTQHIGSLEASAHPAITAPANIPTLPEQTDTASTEDFSRTSLASFVKVKAQMNIMILSFVLYTIMRRKMVFLRFLRLR